MSAIGDWFWDSYTGCKISLEPIGTVDVIIGIVIWILGFTSIIPSITKPIGMKSTEGMSPGTLLLTNIQMTLASCNIFMLKSPQIKLCADNLYVCQKDMLSLYSQLFCWMALFFVFPTVVWYPFPATEEVRARNKRMWITQCIVLLGLFAVCVVLSFTTGLVTDDDGLTNCPLWFGVTGRIFGLAAGALMFFRFFPQLIETCRKRTAGSISYVTYMFIGTGGFVNNYFQIFASKEAVSTWLPTFIGNVFQTVIIATAAFYDYGPGQRCRGKTQSVVDAPVELKQNLEHDVHV